MTVGHLTLITATKPATLGKTFRLNASGLEKQTAGELVAGTFEVVQFADAEEFASLIATVRNDQAIMASTPACGETSGRIVTKDAKPDHPGALSRTKDDFSFKTKQRGVVILDFDPPSGVSLTLSALVALLVSAVPAAAGSSIVGWSSGSSHIFHDDGTEIQGLRGLRLYLLVEDVGDTERFGNMLARRLWLAGHGRIEVSASGQRLVRSTFDTAMHQPARLDFIGGAVCHAPLVQRRGNPTVISDGGWLDTETALPSLTAAEDATYESMVEDTKQKVEPLVIAARNAWKAARLDGETKRLVDSGVAPVQARERAERSLSAALGGTLLGDFVVTMADGSEVPVGVILDHKEKYHGALTRDPLEPGYRHGAQTGKLFLFSAHPILYSQAHGGQKYRLRRQPSRICLSIGRRAEIAEEIARRLAEEPDIFFRGGNPVRLDDGKLIPIRKAATISYLVGTRYALCKINAKGEEIAADLDDATANMVLGLLGSM